MKKSLSLINYLLLFSVLSACQTKQPKTTENKIDTNKSSFTSDSSPNSKVVISSDTSKNNTSTSTHSVKQTTNVSPNNPSNQKAIKSEKINIKRIEHSTDYPEKLDSIKMAKAKLKK